MLVVYENEGKDIVLQEYYKLLNYDELAEHYLEFDTNYDKRDTDYGFCDIVEDANNIQ